MTTFELGQRLVPNLPAQSIIDLSMTDTMEVVDAVNAGLSMFWEKLPDQFKKTQRGVTVNAPTTFDGSTAEFTAGSTDLLLAGITTAALEGCSCIVGGDSQTNRIKSVNEFLLPPLGSATGTHATSIVQINFFAPSPAGVYVLTELGQIGFSATGASSLIVATSLASQMNADATVSAEYYADAYPSGLGYGVRLRYRAIGPCPHYPDVIYSVSGAATEFSSVDGVLTGSLTVYGDAIQIGSDINRLLEPPVIIKADGSRYFLSEFPNGFDPLYVPSQTADPGYYQVDPADRSVSSQSHTNGVAAYSYDGLQSGATIPRSDASYYIRLWPFPQSACRLLYTAELKADHVTWSDFSTSRTLKLVNSDAEGTLIAIVIGELAKKRVFTGDVVAALRDQSTALEQVRDFNSVIGGRPKIKIGTARRY